jgi:hypothetical protein
MVEGRTRAPSVDTPSLDPGLWHHWYPPIASRRQAKKTERLDRERRARPPRLGGAILRCPLLYVRGFLRTGCQVNEPGRVLK